MDCECGRVVSHEPVVLHDQFPDTAIQAAGLDVLLSGQRPHTPAELKSANNMSSLDPMMSNGLADSLRDSLVLQLTGRQIRKSFVFCITDGIGEVVSC
jgi:hypothetical protein